MTSLFDEDIVDTRLDAEIDALIDGEAAEITPRSNPDFFGHEDVEQFLLKDSVSGRMPHAIILAGQNGIGKATLAFRLARFLFSQVEEDSSASLFGDSTPVESLYVSPESPVFKRVVSSGHADLLVIEREFDEKRGRFKSEISVESVRKIHPFLQKTAAEGGWRIVIVDGAEALNRSSQNALLKILEEPPKNTLIILTTSQPGSFLPTIRSRCRTINMKPLNDDVISKLLDKRVPNLSVEDKRVLVKLSEGSIGKAIRLNDQDAVDLYKQILEIVSTVPNLDMVKVHAIGDKLGKFGAEQSYSTAMEIITTWCETQARSVARGNSSINSVVDDRDIVQRIVSSYPRDHFLKAWENISKLVSDVDRYNLDKRQAVMGAFLAIQNPNYKGLSV